MSTGLHTSASTSTFPGSTPQQAFLESSRMNWEPVRSRLLGDDLDDALKAAKELREGIEIVHTVEFPLMLSALLPAFSTILATNPTHPGIAKNTTSTAPVTAAATTNPSIPMQKPATSATTKPEQQPPTDPTTASTPTIDNLEAQHHKHYQLRNTILEIISRMPSNEVLRPHAPHLVAVALDVLIHRRDYEENALLASRIIFDLYKAYRSLPQDYIQPALDFVVSAYKLLPGAVQRSFSFQTLTATAATRRSEPDPISGLSSPLSNQLSSPSKASDEPVPMDTSDSTGSPPTNLGSPSRNPSSFRQISLSPRSNSSFRVLTEWPLIVMLMFQLYPKFLKGNISILIKVMTEALSLRAPSIDSIEKLRQHYLQQQQQQHAKPTDAASAASQQKQPQVARLDDASRRLYFSKSRELVAAQAKTLSFLTYLLRGFSNELKPYEDRLASNVVALMSICPRELLSTRKELLVATRHLLNSDFRKGFFRHVNSLLDEKILIGWSSKHQHRHRYLCHHYSEQSVLRPLGYTVLSDLIQQIRNTPVLNLEQIARVVTIFSRVLHDVSLPMSTQYTAVRTLLSVLDAVYSNKDRNPQLGRDLLVRILRTLVEKLSALHNSNKEIIGKKEDKDSSVTTLPKTNETATSEHHFWFETKTEPLKDKKCIVRAIVVGSKTLIWYINNYRAQREKEKIENIQPPRAGVNNEEVFSGLAKITHAEHHLIDQYIVLGIPCIKILKEKSKEELENRTLATGTAGERPAMEQFRDTLTYFAAAFTTLGGDDLRRIMGRRLDVLVDAIKEDPTAIIIPRHLLSANPQTSFEFCSMMINFLVERMDHLVLAKTENICFLSVSSANESNRLKAFQTRLEEKESMVDEDMRKTSNAYLQLYERILKSLSSYPENERALRPHLKKIVSNCLRSSLEKTDVKADNYCMLLRYVFRSISAGKFEESYRELLPLIPSVLNGLFRVLSSTEDTTLRHTLIELVLTIPARLSSLLPHMNLLLLVIVLALKSNSDDLVNLGLRTLEFWVDNLNPEFLFPELSKQKTVFVSLMKALSIHLRPAPYPYGLLTLRLLGKLGGKNRRVLREPIEIAEPDTFAQNAFEKMSLEFEWSAKSSEDSDGDVDMEPLSTFHIDLPIQRCVELLKRTSRVKIFESEIISSGETSSAEEMKVDVGRFEGQDVRVLLSNDVGDIDILGYCKNVTKETTMNQVKAAIRVLRSALTKIINVPDRSLEDIDYKGITHQTGAEMQFGSGTFDMQTIACGLSKYNSEFHAIAVGLMFGCSLSPIREEEIKFVKGLMTSVYVVVTSNEADIARVDANGSSLTVNSSESEEELKEFGEEGLGSLKPFGYFELNGRLKYTTDPLTINKALAEFLSQPSPAVSEVGLDLLMHVMELPKFFDGSEGNSEGKLNRGAMIYFENLLSSLCTRCVASDWSMRNGLYKGINMMVEVLGQSWARRYEVEIMNVALYSLKSVPAEMSIAGIKSFEFLVSLCANLYGKPSASQSSKIHFVVDMLSLLKPKEDASSETPAAVSKPCDDVLQMLINELASTCHIMRAAARYVFEQYFLNAKAKADIKSILEKQIVLIRRVLFSRSLRLLPLQEQVGAVEALTVLVDRVPNLIPLEDQHLLAFLSELLKMASVADGEMTDNNLVGSVVNKNGFVLPEHRHHNQTNDNQDVDPTLRPSSLFLRRDCILTIESRKLLIGEELPCGIQLRVSSIQLLRSIIRGHPDTFFDSESSTPVGNIRPHVISLLFRSLVSKPIQAVTAAHDALRDVLTLSVVTTDGPEGSRSKSRLRKELLQTCIRPVLLNLRDYTRLNTCLLRGLSQLLSLLSSWFNKTLGEKLLDHLQKWTDPNRIRSHKIWKEGEEPDVAASIVGLFTLLPHASNFVDPLVKTTIKLEACLHLYKSRHVYSPYRKPLALYLNKYSQYTVAFFLQRLKTPLYTELFQNILKFEESTQLRNYLSGRKCSVSVLNVSFERPLAIIRSEKASVTGASPSKTLKGDLSLPLYGIHPFPSRTQSPREVILLRELGTKDKKFQIVKQEFVKAKEYLQVRAAAGRGKNATPEAKSAFEEAKKKHNVAKSAFDKAAKELKATKSLYTDEYLKSNLKNQVPQEAAPNSRDGKRPMTIDSLELQFQGFRLIETLVYYDSSYLKQDSDVLRALRWLWRSKGRYLRMQHEESISPRFQGETKILAYFLVNYSKNSPDDVDLLFELIRIFLQPVSSDFSFVRDFLKDTSSGCLKKEQRDQIMQRFFALMAGESTEEIKLLSLQLVVFPMLHSTFHRNVKQSVNDKDGVESVQSLGAHVVQKFVSDVLYHNGKINSCGEQLKVGLLQVSALFLEFIPEEFKDKGNDLIKFCWSLLKTDDTSCKNWAYVVLCRYINAIDTPQNIVLQVYDTLLRAHQQEGKDLVRLGLNLLVTALPKRLDKPGFKKAVDKTYRLMFEEGNSVPQLAHVWYMVVNHPAIFVRRRSQLVRYMINSLNRLGLPPNSPMENRALALSIVEIVLQWEEEHRENSSKGSESSPDAMDIDDLTNSSSDGTKKSSPDDSMLQIDKSMVETMVNFLVRLKILLADPKVDTHSFNLEPKLDSLLRKLIRRWNGAVIRPLYFDKVVSMCKDDDENFAQSSNAKGKKKNTRETDRTHTKASKSSSTSSKEDDSKRAIPGLPDILAACLEVYLVLAEEDPLNLFLVHNPGQFKCILNVCFRYSKSPTEKHIRSKLEKFLVAFLTLGSRADGRVVQPITVWLEQLLIDTDAAYRKNNDQVGVESSRQARFRQSSHAEEIRPEDCAVLFSLGIIQKVGRISHSFPNLFTSSLISLLSTIVKKHTLQSAAKQKQNGVVYDSQTGTISSRQMYSTPISGILQQVYPENSLSPSSGLARSAQGKQHDLPKELKDFDCMLQSAVIILDVLGTTDSVYSFSNSRKAVVSLVQSIFDFSNNIHLLLACVRIVGGWLKHSGPLTAKERISFFRQISSFDFNGLSDLLSQPLADVVCYYMKALSNQPDIASEEKSDDIDDASSSRSLISCLLTANICAREDILLLLLGSERQFDKQARRPIDVLWQLFHSDFEGLGARHWVVVFVEILLRNVSPIIENEALSEASVRQLLPTPMIGDKTCSSDTSSSVFSTYDVFRYSLQKERLSLNKDAKPLLEALRHLAHGDSFMCQNLMETLLPASWSSIPNDSDKLRLVSAIESFLAQSFHAQAFKKEMNGTLLPSNAIKSFLSSVVLLNPLPFIDIDLLVMLAQNYNAWYEVLTILENQYFVISSTKLPEHGSITGDKVLLAMRHCYRQLGETKIWSSLALKSCVLPASSYATSLEIYGKVDKALEAYNGLIDLVESEESTNATYFEMDYWEERWVDLQQQQQQLEVVSEYARHSKNDEIMLECAWRERNWDSVRSLCSSPTIVAAVESGNPAMKICEALSAVADGKLGDVENLHAQSSQLALYKWQNLPAFSGGSCAHAKLLHYFHRLVEIRESGQIMVETNNHSTGKTLPDLKNLLNAWRHRLPNDEEDLTMWDEIFTWRAHMFNAITSNFHWSEPSTLATLHDRPWTAIRMSMVARKQGMQQTAFLLLNRLTDSRSMDVSDAYLKLREQILLFNNPDNDLERTGGLNLINTTNLSYFDSSQKGELFRLKAIFLASLRRTSKSNQAYCHSVQICPSHTKSWISWGGLCSSLGSMTEKQAEQVRASGGDKTRESRADSTKKVAQYLAQAMGCFIEAIQIDPNEKSRIHLPRCLWMLTKDGSAPGVLCQTLENRGTKLPPWVWLPWIPQLLTGLCRLEGRAIKAILSRVIKAYPQAAYYSLRAFYLERRDVERSKGGNIAPGQHMPSVAYAEEMMSTLRRSHASLWSSLEAILEELIVKFRPSYEEELLATISALLERAESHAEKQSLPDKKRIEDEEAMVASWSKTLSRIAAKFFRETDSSSSSNRRDERVKKTADFKRKYKADFEQDFKVATPEAKGGTTVTTAKAQFRLAEYITKLQAWKEKLEIQVARTPNFLPLIESSHSLAMFHGSFPNLWPGSCDTRYSYGSNRSLAEDTTSSRTPPSASSSAAIARKAALNAALAAAKAAAREGVGGEYGGGSASIEIPGQYCPNTSSSVDIKPCPELHAKLIKFEPYVEVLRRNDQLVRRCGMIGSDGRTYKFLLQFAIPYWTRTDERAAQTSYVIDKFLRKNMVAARNHIQIQPTAAIPVAQRLRMTPDPDCRRALDEVWRNHREKEQGGKSVAAFFSKELTKRLKNAVSHDASDEQKRKAEREVRFEVYNEICTTLVDDQVLLRYLMKVFDSPESFFLFRRAFAVHLAANSLLQYVFSVAERTPQRFVILQSNGKMMSPDFRISYSNQGFIEGYNQVPFRMTPNIQRALGEHYIQGIFVRTMAMIAGAVREHKEEFDPILRLLMRDDILAWYSKSLAKTDSKTQELEKQLIERVSKNVYTLQARFSDCSPKASHESNVGGKNDSAMPLDKRVIELVEVATSPENLCMTRISYQGWL